MYACAPGSPPSPPPSCRCRLLGPIMLGTESGASRRAAKPLHYGAMAMPQFLILKTYFKVRAEGFAKTSAAFYKRLIYFPNFFIFLRQAVLDWLGRPGWPPSDRNLLPLPLSVGMGLKECVTMSSLDPGFSCLKCCRSVSLRRRGPNLSIVQSFYSRKQS